MEEEFINERNKSYDLLMKMRELTVWYDVKEMINSKRNTKTGQLHKLTLDSLEEEVLEKIKNLKNE